MNLRELISNTAVSVPNLDLESTLSNWTYLSMHLSSGQYDIPALAKLLKYELMTKRRPMICTRLGQRITSTVRANMQTELMELIDEYQTSRT